MNNIPTTYKQHTYNGDCVACMLCKYILLNTNIAYLLAVICSCNFAYISKTKQKNDNEMFSS